LSHHWSQFTLFTLFATVCRLYYWWGCTAVIRIYFSCGTDCKHGKLNYANQLDGIAVSNNSQIWTYKHWKTNSDWWLLQLHIDLKIHSKPAHQYTLLELEPRSYKLDPITNNHLCQLCALWNGERTRPSGSKTKAMSFIVPSLGLFLNVTLSCSNLAQAFSISSTVMAIWPKPRPMSSFPDA